MMKRIRHKIFALITYDLKNVVTKREKDLDRVSKSNQLGES